MLLEITRAMEIFPERLKKLWNIWEIHSLATVSLSVLASKVSDSEEIKSSLQATDSLQSFWAPFLLLHLGGPDSITAYSLEDNELWLRHFVVLLVQIGVAFYVFLRTWSNSTAITFIAIPMLITGVIKYGERTFVLRSSSTEHFKKNLSLHPDTCQDLVIIKTTPEEELEDPSKAVVPKNGVDTAEDSLLALGYFSFKRFEFLFAGRTLPSGDWTTSYLIVRYKEAQDAFKLIEVELGFMYDVLYTKATLVYSRLGIFLRCISFFSSVSALVLFTITIDVHRHSYLWMDISVTFLLLVAAVLMEIYAFIVLLFSDWALLWLIKIKEKQYNLPLISKARVEHFQRFISNCRSLSFLSNRKRWSGCIGQYNLISCCLKKSQQQPAYTRVQDQLPFTNELLEKYRYLTWEDVTSDLQNTVFSHLKSKAEELEQCRKFKPSLYVQSRDKVLAERGNYALSHFDLSRFLWTITGVEFDTSLLLWHIATDLCYYHYLNDKCTGDAAKLVPKSTEFFKKKKQAAVSADNKLAFDGRSALLHEILQEPREITLSVLRDGCGIGINLISSASDDDPSEHIWEVISGVWVEMLVYAANNCGWKEHAQSLVKGGELLTHVCLLMTYFGLTKQFVNKT
ncbi:hypothetical protein JRO89_XS09G0225900 [Xanthoceras sorbifolium]|uniref:DUF4220 domain-containing protein n=1 Tax=Xanthoceras sorbifolium TaxID=99658 RepID=A0ABQ8HMH3_9ROSI|nr:hypothetical protein JRO89_XS09G0225900 [Xanthoceras sorbifolium]